MVRTSNRITEAAQACAMRLWGIATDKDGSGDIKQSATKHICDLLRNYEWRKVRISYIHDCVQLLKDRRAVSVALQILTKLLETLSSMRNYHPATDSHNRYTMIEILEKEDDLTSALFAELEAYYDGLVASGKILTDLSMVGD